MARVSKADVDAELATRPPKKKLVIYGNSVSTQGRITTLMKIRPSLMRRVESLVLAPTYLTLELALEELCDSLEQLPEKARRTIIASDFDPTAEDIAEVEAMHLKRETEGRQANRSKIKRVVPDVAPAEKEK